MLESKPLVVTERETHSKQIRKRGLYGEATGVTYHQVRRFSSRRTWTHGHESKVYFFAQSIHSTSGFVLQVFVDHLPFAMYCA